jgi:hypothetical protein
MGTRTFFRGKLKILKGFMRNGLPQEKELSGHLMESSLSQRVGRWE